MPRSGSNPQGLSRPYLTGLAVALIFGAAIFFRLYELGSRNLWTDEAWVALAVMQPTAKEALAAGQSTPPFYLLTIWAMVQLWGHSEMVLRGLSWLFGVGTLGLIWRFSRRLVEVPAALLALAAVAFSPIMVYYSKELKQYSGDAFFAVLVLWLTERLQARGGQQGWLPLALAGVVGLGFSQPLIFTLPVAGAVLWLTLPRPQRLRLACLGGVWLLAAAGYYLLFIRREIDPELVAYWTQDFPDLSGLLPFFRWLGPALYRYFWYFLGEWGVIWGPLLLAAGMTVMVQRGRGTGLTLSGGAAAPGLRGRLPAPLPFHGPLRRQSPDAVQRPGPLSARGGWRLGHFRLALEPAPAASGPGPDRVCCWWPLTSGPGSKKTSPPSTTGRRFNPWWLTWKPTFSPRT